jgi:hypothetical protein
MMKRARLFLILIAFLLLAGSALAMGSANYRLDWFTPLTGNGGGAIDSTNYAANFTVGQTVIGTSYSANYRIGLGYWYGGTKATEELQIYLPLVLRNT